MYISFQQTSAQLFCSQRIWSSGWHVRSQTTYKQVISNIAKINTQGSPSVASTDLICTQMITLVNSKPRICIPLFVKGVQYFDCFGTQFILHIVCFQALKKAWLFLKKKVTCMQFTSYIYHILNFFTVPGWRL